MSKLVTKESLIRLLNDPNPAKVQVVIGRALVAIFNNQTKDEQATNDVREFNGIGFTGADGRSGSITAKYFLKHRRLLDWQIERWMKPNRNGIPRIAKYWSQLNKVAEAKAA